MLNKIIGLILCFIGVTFTFAGLINLFIKGDLAIDMFITIFLGLLPLFFGIKLFKNKKDIIKMQLDKNKIEIPQFIPEANIESIDNIKHEYCDLSLLKFDPEMDFYVLDVETANQKNSSICQIGIAGFKNNVLINSWGTYINPEEEYSSINIGIHGINSEMTNGKPTFHDVYKYLKELENSIVIQHTGFDKSSVNNTSIKYNLPILNYKWLDSSLIVKRTWKEVSKRGYGLTDLSKKFNFDFIHHDAIEDAIVTGKIVVKAVNTSNISINEWLTAVKKPLQSFYQ